MHLILVSLINAIKICNYLYLHHIIKNKILKSKQFFKCKEKQVNKNNFKPISFDCLKSSFIVHNVPPLFITIAAVIKLVLATFFLVYLILFPSRLLFEHLH